MNLLTHGYETSKDYETLFELIKTSRIVCFVDSDCAFGGEKIQDICQSGPSSDEAGIYGIHIGARGITYVTAYGPDEALQKEKFIAQCKKLNLEYIAPSLHKKD